MSKFNEMLITVAENVLDELDYKGMYNSVSYPLNLLVDDYDDIDESTVADLYIDTEESNREYIYEMIDNELEKVNLRNMDFEELVYNMIYDEIIQNLVWHIEKLR